MVGIECVGVKETENKIRPEKAGSGRANYELLSQE